MYIFISKNIYTMGVSLINYPRTVFGLGDHRKQTLKQQCLARPSNSA